MEGSQSPAPSSVFVSAHGYTSGSDRLFGRRDSLSPRTSRTNINAAAPMPMPNASKGTWAPPPLPPPPAPLDLSKGRDLSWEHANPGHRREDPISRPVSPLSSPWSERKGSRASDGPPRMQVASRRESSVSTLRSPPSIDSLDPERDEGYCSLSGTSFAQLHGERSLDRQNRKDSSHAYDKSVLSKIGGPRTPTRASTSSTTSSIEGTGRPLQLQSLSISESLSGGSSFDSPVSSKWVHSPQSVVTSPSFGTSITSPRSYLDPYRKLTLDTNSIVSSASGSVSASASASGSTGGTGAEVVPDTRFDRIEPRRTQRSDSSNLSRMMAFSATGNNPSLPLTSSAGMPSASLVSSNDPGSRKRAASERGNSLASDPRSGLGPSAPKPPAPAPPAPAPAAPLTGAPPVLRPHPNPHHRLEERVHPSPPTFTTPTYNPLASRVPPNSARHGMLGKRKASSPARGASQVDKPPPHTKAQQLQHPSPQSTPAKRGTPLAQASYANPPGSSNSSSSTAPNGSYAPSPGFAVGTRNASALPQEGPQLYPTAPATNSSEQSHRNQSPFANSGAFDPALSNDDANYNAQLASSAQLTAAAAQKVSAENASRMKQTTQPKLANMHICDCCPKKPKKFDTFEELHQHQSEKQYVCQYCQNRFKNKNEAERHQNSLHLRRHSWSCATLEHYEHAFHPCTAVPPNTGTGQTSQQPQVPQSPEFAPYDVCGYCGQQFSNTPAPDWLARSQHLTSEHKFGECNQSKKFFRADHFRQHLKHSHGGTSGKWTNMLEAACMKDEPPITAEAQAQSAQAQATAQHQPPSQAQSSQPSSQVASPRKEAQPHLQPQAATQQPGVSPLHGAPVGGMMQSAHYPAMGNVGATGRGSINGGDFQFTTTEEHTKQEEE